MRARQGIQAEILLSLALVMVTGTGLLAGVFLEFNHARLQTLHGLLAHGFVSEVHAPGLDFRVPESGLWWRLTSVDHFVGLNVMADEIDAQSVSLAEEA